MRVPGRRWVLAAIAWFGVLLAWAAANAAETTPEAALERGVLAFREGRPNEALELWRAADQGFGQRGDSDGRLQALLRRAEALEAQGLSRQALRELAICRALILPDAQPEARFEPEEICSLSNRQAAHPMLPALAAGLGRTCSALGARTQARALLQTSAELAKVGDQDAVAAAARFELARLNAIEGDYEGARRQLETLQALPLAAGDRQLSATVLLELARVDLAIVREAARNEAAPALAIAKRETADGLMQAAAAIRLVEDARERARLMIERASLALDLAETGSGSPVPAQSIYKDLVAAHALAQRAGAADLGLLSSALRELGRLYAQADRAGEALQITERALLAAQALGAPALLYPAYAQLGRILGSRSLNRSIEAYGRAVEALESVRPGVAAAGGARAGAAEIYLAYADALLARARRTSGALAGASGAAARQMVNAVQQDRRAARAVVERWKAAELQDFFLDDCVATLQARVRGIDSLTMDAAALYPIVFEDRLELLLSVRGRIEHATVPVGRAALAREVDAFRCVVDDEARADLELCGAHAGSKQDWDAVTAPAERLYQLLVAPLEPHLQESAGAPIETIVFLPDGPLRRLPLAALFDGRQFLIQRFAIAVAPGLELLDPKPMPSDASALVAGLTEKVQGWDELAGVQDEVMAVRELAPRPEVLVGSRFTPSGLQQALRQHAYGILHLATHAQFRGEAQDNFLLTLGDEAGQPVRLSMDDLEDLVKTSEFRTMPIELLVLSACQTAAGDDRAALGLAGVGIKAGARSVLASLWNVHDEAAARLVPAFYRNLAGSRPDGRPASKAWALQQAQIEALARREPPYLWAPFVLIGSWL